MTIEEAIRILDEILDESHRNNLFQNAEKLDYEDALYMAIAVLRERQEIGNNRRFKMSIEDYVEQRQNYTLGAMPVPIIL
jgi:hypothetical protein